MLLQDRRGNEPGESETKESVPGGSGRRHCLPPLQEWRSARIFVEILKNPGGNGLPRRGATRPAATCVRRDAQTSQTGGLHFL
jgi:hypothetical protein